MNSDTVLQRLRLFLLVLAGMIFAGVIVELALMEHFKEALQLIPFILSAVGLLLVALVLWRPQRRTLLALRWVMAVVALGSLVGMFLHIQNNLSFEMEMRPGSTIADVFVQALSGASPLLAPGILALAAVLALAATYVHPALTPDRP